MWGSISDGKTIRARGWRCKSVVAQDGASSGRACSEVSPDYANEDLEAYQGGNGVVNANANANAVMMLKRERQDSAYGLSWADDR